MKILWEKEWDKIYKQYGEVQSEILPTVILSVEIFNEYKCINIMDLGCGTGRHTIFLAQNNFNVLAVDISETGLDTTKTKANNLVLNNIKYMQSDMRNIPLDENTLDGILCVWTTGHGKLNDVEKNVNEIYRILKPNGVVIIDYVSTEDEHYGKGEEIEKNTFLNNMEGEENIPHHYSTKMEIEYLYKKFNEIKIEPINYYYGNNNENKIKAYLVIGVK
jgi:ubiquinone/menaquinone biosynthesis C-methylase UbiE